MASPSALVREPLTPSPATPPGGPVVSCIAARLAKRAQGGIVPGMNDDESNPAALRALQEDVFRRKVLRARGMTPTQRFDEALELSQSIFEWMHSGAMEQCGFTDPEDGWLEVKRRLSRLRRFQEYNLYRPAAAR